MDIKQIQQAISELNTVSVRGGGKYTMVAPRVETFRKFVGVDLGIDTELLVDNEQRVVIKALIKDKSGFTVASGLAEELRGSSAVNRSAAIENCETSAVGRALASLGLHGGEYASIEEIDKAKRNGAIRNERERKPPKAPQTHSAPPLMDLDKWQVWVVDQKRALDYCNEKYQLKKWGSDTKQMREELQEFDRELMANLKDHFNMKHDELNSGVRK